jgi:hypothetical protein
MQIEPTDGTQAKRGSKKMHGSRQGCIMRGVTKPFRSSRTGVPLARSAWFWGSVASSEMAFVAVSLIGASGRA